MKIKTIFTVVLLLIVAESAFADSKKVYFTYQSVDCDNNPVTLSACLGLPTSKSKRIDFIVLHNHPTAAYAEQVPTGSEPMDQVTQLGLHTNGLMNDIADEGALIVSPDYMGYGATKDRIHPYFATLHTARTCVDAELAAIEYAKSQGYTLNPKYYTISAGYSQGGTMALAVQRYIETVASKDVVEKINLKESYCGAGAYDLGMTFNDWVDSPDIFYPGGAVWIVQGMTEAYKEGCMRGIKVEQLLSDSFNESGLLNVINEKSKVMGEVNSMIKNGVGNKDGKIAADELFSEGMLNPDSPLSKAVRKALNKNNLLTGWTPQHPIYLFHWKDDETVTYKNAEAIKRQWPNMVIEQDVNPSVLSRSFNKSDTNLMYVAKKGDATHIGYASRWYIFFYDGMLRKH